MDVKLKNILAEKKSLILKKWFEAIIETYPKDTSGFLKSQKDQFTNPVGHTISQGIESILEALIEEKDLTEGLPFLDDIIRVRAIQDFTPSKAMSFIFLFKKVVHEELAKEIGQSEVADALLELESRIDDLALISFDRYIECRERIYRIKTEELQRMTHMLLKKASLVSEVTDQKFEEKDQE